ncbi:hypothetical protein [Nocardia sp. NPDC057440]|uniref:hypothetical protein n=1 Tax=Nocardia sp. NPDC057440 TaxID=3346134 RepID=UPI003672B892
MTTGAELYEMLADSPAGADLKITALGDDYSIVWRWENKVLDYIRETRKGMGLDALREMLAEMAEEDIARRVQLWVEVPHTVHDERTRNGSLGDEVNARHIIENYGSYDSKGYWADNSKIRVFDTQFSRSVYVPIFKGSNGIGLDMLVSDALVDCVDTLIEHGYIDDGDTRGVIEQETIEKDWDSFVRSDVVDKFSDEVENKWIELSVDQENGVLGQALERMYKNDSPEFDGDSWSVDSDRLAEIISDILGESAAAE